MSNQFSYLSITKESLPQDVLSMFEKMDDLCASYQAEGDQKAILEELHSLYWQSLVILIPSFIQEDQKERLIIPDIFKKWLNFGWLSNVIREESVEMKASISGKSSSEPSIHDEYKVYYFCDWLIWTYNKIVRVDHKIRIENEYKKAKNELDNHPAMLEQCIKRRQIFLQKHPLAKKVMQISQEIDDLLSPYSTIKKKIDSSQRLTTEERIRYVQLTEEIADLRGKRAIEQQAISTHVPQHELMRIDREIEHVILIKRQLEEKYQKAHYAHQEDLEFRRKLSVTLCRGKLKEEIRRVRGATDMIAKRSRIKQCSILSGYQPITTPQGIVESLEEILEIDQTFMKSKNIQKTKFPIIVILPAFGDGVYDFEHHAFLVPIRTIKGVLQAVSTSLVEFLLDSPAGKNFKESYLKLDKNKKMASSIQIREQIIKDYIGWVTLEAKGYQVLDADTRKWFIENIAPPMFALKYPRYCEIATIAAADEQIEIYEKQLQENENDFDAQFRLGLACWKVRQYIKANIAFVKAFELNPESLDACYNVALSCFKTGQKKKAQDFWKTYLLLDKASFWTMRVQKFLSTMQ